MSDGTIAILMIGLGAGGYALWKHLDNKAKEDKAKGRGGKTRTGEAPTRGARPSDPHNCLCPMSLDPLDPTLPTYTCSCSGQGAVRPPYATGYGGYHAGSPPDPRNCLCPMSADPLNPTLPTYSCPCNVPGAVRP